MCVAVIDVYSDDEFDNCRRRRRRIYAVRTNSQLNTAADHWQQTKVGVIYRELSSLRNLEEVNAFL